MAEGEVRINLRLPETLVDRLQQVAMDRMVGISLLAAKLLEHGLNNLPDPNWPDQQLPHTLETTWAEKIEDARSQSKESLQ